MDAFSPPFHSNCQICVPVTRAGRVRIVRCRALLVPMAGTAHPHAFVVKLSSVTGLQEFVIVVQVSSESIVKKVRHMTIFHVIMIIVMVMTVIFNNHYTNGNDNNHNSV